MRNAPDATAAPLAAAKHWDFILQSHDYGGHSGTFTNGYPARRPLGAAPGSTDTDGKSSRPRWSPLLDKLVGRRRLARYTIDTENIHTGPVGTLFLVIIANGRGRHRQIRRRLEEAEKSNPAAWAGTSQRTGREGPLPTPLARVSADGSEVASSAAPARPLFKTPRRIRRAGLAPPGVAHTKNDPPLPPASCAAVLTLFCSTFAEIDHRWRRRGKIFVLLAR